MEEGMDHMAREQFEGANPRVFGSNPDNPEKGRIFVWTKMGWLEREEGPWGEVAFSPIADSEDQLKDILNEEDPDSDLVELEGKLGKTVYQEFMESAESTLYPEAPETSDEEPFDEQNVT
jgi:hypothetical protein